MHLIIILQVSFYKTSPLERKLRNTIDYMISLCYLLPFIFMGKFVDSDNEDSDSDQIQPMEWLGFLRDENIHYSVGFV